MNTTILETHTIVKRVRPYLSPTGWDNIAIALSVDAFRAKYSDSTCFIRYLDWAESNQQRSEIIIFNLAHDLTLATDPMPGVPRTMSY